MRGARVVGMLRCPPFMTYDLVEVSPVSAPADIWAVERY